MLKVRGWIGIFSAPILLASVGCSIGPRSTMAGHRMLPPERLMSMARTFERQGHLAQAKTAYLQVLAFNPDFPNAKANLDTLIATEMDRTQGGRSNSNAFPNQGVVPQTLLTESKIQVPESQGRHVVANGAKGACGQVMVVVGEGGPCC